MSLIISLIAFLIFSYSPPQKEAEWKDGDVWEQSGAGRLCSASFTFPY